MGLYNTLTDIAIRAAGGRVDSILASSSDDCWFDPVSISNFSAELYLETSNTYNAHTNVQINDFVLRILI